MRYNKVFSLYKIILSKARRGNSCSQRAFSHQRRSIVQQILTSFLFPVLPLKTKSKRLQDQRPDVFQVINSPSLSELIPSYFTISLRQQKIIVDNYSGIIALYNNNNIPLWSQSGVIYAHPMCETLLSDYIFPQFASVSIFSQQKLLFQSFPSQAVIKNNRLYILLRERNYLHIEKDSERTTHTYFLSFDLKKEGKLMWKTPLFLPDISINNTFPNIQAHISSITYTDRLLIKLLNGDKTISFIIDSISGTLLTNPH